MNSVPATALRQDLFAILKRMAYEKKPILIERRGKAIAALVAVEDVIDAPARPPRQVPVPVTRGRGLTTDIKALHDFCAAHHVKTLALFGSVLTDDFRDDSDVDVMFESEGASPSFFEQMAMTDELERLFERPVDLVARRAVEESTNTFRRKSILDSARIIYAR